MTAIGLFMVMVTFFYVMLTDEPRRYVIKVIMGFVFLIGMGLMGIGSVIMLWESMP